MKFEDILLFRSEAVNTRSGPTSIIVRVVSNFVFA